MTAAILGAHYITGASANVTSASRLYHLSKIGPFRSADAASGICSTASKEINRHAISASKPTRNSLR